MYCTKTFEHSLKDQGFKLCLQPHHWVFVEETLAGTVFTCKHHGSLTDVFQHIYYILGRGWLMQFSCPQQVKIDNEY